MVGVCHVCAGAQEGQKRVEEPLVLEAKSPILGAGNQTQVMLFTDSSSLQIQFIVFFNVLTFITFN